MYAVPPTWVESRTKKLPNSSCPTCRARIAAPAVIDNGERGTSVPRYAGMPDFARPQRTGGLTSCFSWLPSSGGLEPRQRRQTGSTGRKPGDMRRRAFPSLSFFFRSEPRLGAAPYRQTARTRFRLARSDAAPNGALSEERERRLRAPPPVTGLTPGATVRPPLMRLQTTRTRQPSQTP